MKKKIYGKRFLSASIAAVLAMTASPVQVLAAENSGAGVSDASLIANFTFNDEESGFQGAGAKAVKQGNPETVAVGTNQVLYLNGSNQYLNVTAKDGSGLLKGLDEITISYDSCPQKSAGSWVFFAAPNSATQVYRSEHYMGILDKPAGMEIERYNSNNADRPGQLIASNLESGWKHVDVVVKEGETELYVNQELVKTVSSSVLLSDILGSEGGILQIGKGNWEKGEYYEGYLDNLQIYSEAMTQEQIQSRVTVVYRAGENGSVEGNVIQSIDKGQSTQAVTAVPDKGYHFTGWSDGYEEEVRSDADVTSSQSVTANFEKNKITLDEVKESLIIPDANDIRGNITLPTQMEDAVISWEKVSGKDGVITLADSANKDYDSTPAGVVTRGDQDEKVTLKAVISIDGKTAGKTFDLTVKAKSGITEEDYEGYVFAHFKGEGLAQGEQIYFAASEDGLHWTDMNEGDPVVTSDYGEKGLRDPFIIRSPEGDKFYLIATDLKINGGNGWNAAQTAGSQSIMVWESTDMVNWSDQRMVKVALDDAGCTWAPEAFYDDVTGEYVVFWASKTSEDNYGVQKVYYCKTRDFYTFTEPQVWIELYKSTNSKPLSVIDTSVISVMENGKKVYYRFSKDEASEDHDADGGDGKYIYMEKSDSLLGEWMEVKALKDQKWVEGGTSFKFNGEDRWCLLLDNFGGIGYYPMVTNDMGSGNFTRLDTSQYSFPSTMRHGTVLPLTRKEYEAVLEKWNTPVTENTEPAKEEAVLSYDFEEAADGTIKDGSANGQDGRLYGNAAYVEDPEKGGQVLYLDGQEHSYAAFPEGFFDGRNQLTISMDIKADTVSGNFFTFGIGRDTEKYLFLKTTDTESRVSMTAASYGNEQTAKGTTEAIKNRWINMTIVAEPGTIALYADGALLSEQKVSLKMTDLGKNLKAYLGKSFFSGDNYFKGYFDNVEVFNRAMTAEEIEKRNTEYTLTYLAQAGGRIEGESVQVLAYGAVGAAVKAVPDDGYTFVKWSDGSTQAVRTDKAEKDTVFTAYFEKKPVTPPEEKPGDGQKPGDEVKPVQPSGVSLNVRKLTVGVKEKTVLKANVLPAAASQKVTWTSSKKSVVSVINGKLTAKKAGNATITATASNGKKLSCKVTVKKAPKKITLNKKEKVLKKGKAFKIKVKLPAKTASYKITYTSSKKAIASVSAKGVVTAKRKGSAVITVKTFNGKKAKIKIKVR